MCQWIYYNIVTVHQTQVSDLMYSISFINNVLGIYLMFNGDCYPNGSYIDHIYTTKDNVTYSPLKCALPNTALSDGQWVNWFWSPHIQQHTKRELPKVSDAEKESLYVYVFGVSGPGK